MVRSGHVMQMKSCIIKCDLSVCRIFSFFVHTARNSIAVVRHVYVLLFEIEISDVRFFRFGCDFGRLFGRDLGCDLGCDLGFCLRFDFGFDCGCRYTGCIRFAFGILNALVVLNALVILHACTLSIVVRHRCDFYCRDRRSRVIGFNEVFPLLFVFIIILRFVR